VYSTQVYFYIPRQIVVLYDGTSTRRYQTVYAKNLTLHKGVDNKLQFQFINQEEKPVDITGKELTFRFISYDGTTTLIRKTLTLLLPLTGIAQLELNAADIEDIDPQNGFYSLEIPVGSFAYPVFVDAMSGARGKMSIVDSVLPSFIPSMEINPNATGNATTFYSSTIDTTANPIITLQTAYSNFAGNVSFQGSTTGSDWYTIEQMNVANAVTTTFGNSFVGFHPYMRVKFDKLNGNVVGNILVR
jgi:hypothetical protein